MVLDSPLPLPKFRLGADNFAGCPSRGKRSLTKTDRQKIVRSHGGIGQSVAKKWIGQRVAKKIQWVAKKSEVEVVEKIEVIAKRKNQSVTKTDYFLSGKEEFNKSPARTPKASAIL